MLRDVLVRLVLLHDVSYAAADDSRGDHYLGPLLYMAAEAEDHAISAESILTSKNL